MLIKTKRGSRRVRKQRVVRQSDCALSNMSDDEAYEHVKQAFNDLYHLAS
jgi:hypothetical protein